MNKFIMLKKKLQINFINILIIFLLTTALSACNIYKPTKIKDNPINDKAKRQKNIQEGRGLTLLSNKNRQGGGGNFNFANSNPLWRATISILDFMPLSNVDYGGGIIITDWYADNINSNESLKISVQFLASEIRADALNIKIYKKDCSISETCKVIAINSKMVNDIRLAILKEAAKIQTNSKVVNEEYKIIDPQ